MRCFAFHGGLFSSSTTLSKSFLLYAEGFVAKGKEDGLRDTRRTYESLAEARRNTERNARAANLGLPSLAATKRHYPRLDTLATLSLPPPSSPSPFPSAIPLLARASSSSFALTCSPSLCLSPICPALASPILHLSRTLGIYVHRVYGGYTRRVDSERLTGGGS